MHLCILTFVSLNNVRLKELSVYLITEHEHVTFFVVPVVYQLYAKRMYLCPLLLQLFLGKLDVVFGIPYCQEIVSGFIDSKLI